MKQTTTARSEHQGHRERMREKFFRFGPWVFDTHELIEMLLYFFVPYRDTNPIAHRLLQHFGTVQRLLYATEEQLCEVSGIGPAIAWRLSRLFRSGLEYFCFLGTDAQQEQRQVIVNDFQAAGRMARDFIRDPADPCVYAMLLDNNLSVITIEPIHNGPYSTLAEHVPSLVQRAIDQSAAAIILFHTHPNGPLFSTPDERGVDSLLRTSLSALSLTLVERYIVCGQRYYGALNNYKNVFEQSFGAALDTFYDSYPEESTEVDDGYTLHEPTYESTSIHALLRVPPRQFFYGLFRLTYFREERCATVARALEQQYKTVKRAMNIDINELGRRPHIGTRAAWFLRLQTALLGRGMMERMRVGCSHSLEDARDYLVGCMLGEGIEHGFALFFDANMRFLAAEWLGCGGVNSTVISNRRVVELGIRHRAVNVILSHNHPNGTPEPSMQDILAANEEMKILQAAGLRLLEHYVVSGGSVSAVFDRSASALTQRYVFEPSVPYEEHLIFPTE